MGHDAFGREIPDNRPVEVPLNFKRPLSIQEEIKRYIREELSFRASESGEETFEEADDFEVDDPDGEYLSPYELTMMQEESRVLPDASNLERQKGRSNEDRSDSRGTGSDQAVSGAIREDAKAEVIGKSVAGGREESKGTSGNMQQGAK